MTEEFERHTIKVDDISYDAPIDDEEFNGLLGKIRLLDAKSSELTNLKAPLTLTKHCYFEELRALFSIPNDKS